MFKNPLTEKIYGFLTEIGLQIKAGSTPDNCFLPGILVSAGGLIVDEDKLKYPGDLLHEAGHLAVATKTDRMKLDNNVSNNPGDELATLAWSWAALVHLDLDPEIVFHPQGYKGDSTWLIEVFSQGNSPGAPLLQWMGLAWHDDEVNEKNYAQFPKMKRWLRQ